MCELLHTFAPICPPHSLLFFLSRSFVVCVKQGFLKHLLRVEYGTFQLAADTNYNPGTLSRFATYFRVTLEETLYVVPVLAMLGVAVVCGSRRRVLRLWGVLSLSSYVLYLTVFHYLANLDLTPLLLGVQARFWQQASGDFFYLTNILIPYLYR